uniref:L-amino acid transport system permease protein n=1 Tax=uncultured Chloroflexota bacterium TaxID=166587 RepID=H5SK76_9CHLR|nr:polar amino acid ABC transporter inner membrane subunit [uncultured bacterium]BAL56562.1 L-amino acid transport system permease protein [uncultured Chloroflexota bacterium]
MERYTILGWIYKNLLNPWYNALLTVLALWLIYALSVPLLRWAFTQARWEVIAVNLRLFIAGQYPEEERWRLWLSLHIFAFVIGFSWAIFARGRRWIGLALLLTPWALALIPGFSTATRTHLLVLSIVTLIAFFLARNGGPGARRYLITLWISSFLLFILLVRGLTPPDGWFPVVPTNLWGGLVLTFLLTVIGILLSLPLGLLLALGRRSRLPIIRWVSIAYIELVRGVPLVTILFMAQIMLPLFLPGNMNLDRVLRAMVGIILFTAAYQAENVRGGLQAIPHGQYEAAYALGLNGFQTNLFIILPQALRNVIPVLVGQFIALYKDTSLVAIVGLLDLLGIARAVLAQPAYVGTQREVYLFISAIYWLFSYVMAYLSQRLEKALGVGER